MKEDVVVASLHAQGMFEIIDSLAQFFYLTFTPVTSSSCSTPFYGCCIYVSR